MLPPSPVCPGTPADPCSPLSHNPPQFGVIPKHAKGVLPPVASAICILPGRRMLSSVSPSRNCLQPAMG